MPYPKEILDHIKNFGKCHYESIHDPAKLYTLYFKVIREHKYSKFHDLNIRDGGYCRNLMRCLFPKIVNQIMTTLTNKRKLTNHLKAMNSEFYTTVIWHYGGKMFINEHITEKVKSYKQVLLKIKMEKELLSRGTILK